MTTISPEKANAKEARKQASEAWFQALHPRYEDNEDYEDDKDYQIADSKCDEATSEVYAAERDLEMAEMALADAKEKRKEAREACKDNDRGLMEQEAFVQL